MGIQKSTPVSLLAHLKWPLCTMILLSTVASMSSGDSRAFARNQPKIRGKKIEGFTQITERWPLNEKREYFLAHKKELYLIEIKKRPTTTDFEVKLEYYYQYSKTKPIVLMVPCTINSIEVVQVNGSDPRGMWQTHTQVVNKRDCISGAALKYQVILQDEGDIFAWKHITIKFLNNNNGDLSGESTESNAQVGDTEAPVSSGSQPAGSLEGGNNGATTSSTSATDGSLATATETSGPATTTDISAGDSATNQTTGNDEMPPPTGSNSGISSENSTLSPATTVTATTPPPVTSTINVWKELDRIIFPPRKKRDSSNSIDISQTLVCKPSSCNRAIFEIPRFIPLIKELPKLPDGISFGAGNNFFLSTEKNKPLKLKSYSNMDLSSVDECVEIRVFMDPGTKLELSLEGKDAKTFNQTLDLIEMKQGDPMASKWDLFQRCVSDYIPKFVPVGPGYFSFKFTPLDFNPSKRVAVLTNSRTVSLRWPYRALTYLKNAADLQDATSLTELWFFDKSGIDNQGAKVEIKPATGAQEAANGVNGKTILRISDIDSKQESFNITSRWLKVANTGDSTGNPVEFIYNATKTNWIKSIDFSVQKYNKTGSLITETLYIAKTDENNNGPPATTSDTVSEQSTPPTVNSNKNSNDSPPGASEAEAPSAKIKRTKESRSFLQIEGQDPFVQRFDYNSLNVNDSFRFIITHHVKDEIRQQVASAESAAEESRVGSESGESTTTTIGAPESLVLEINRLSYGDLCADPNRYCKNDATCEPNGSGSAKCQCLQGYTGDQCERADPCERLYGSLTGRELCALAGAECVESPFVPELRCRWNPDNYFNCTPTYGEDGNPVGQPATPATSEGRGSQESNTVEPTQLTKKEEEQAKTIIILTVFLVATVLLLLVIIGSMVGRLMKSKERLNMAQNEVHELTRRSHQVGSSTNFARVAAGSRHRSSGAIFNNQAFDAA